VGHIALDTEYETEKFRGDDREGLYWISTFYISHALQNCGLGRAAMDVIENMATAEPLCAKTLALSTLAATEVRLTRQKWERMGIDPPKVSLYSGAVNCRLTWL
jgi:GNAT superfamily N-acetyltransferase